MVKRDALKSRVNDTTDEPLPKGIVRVRFGNELPLPWVLGGIGLVFVFTANLYMTVMKADGINTAQSTRIVALEKDSQTNAADIRAVKNDVGNAKTEANTSILALKSQVEKDNNQLRTDLMAQMGQIQTTMAVIQADLKNYYRPDAKRSEKR